MAHKRISAGVQSYRIMDRVCFSVIHALDKKRDALIARMAEAVCDHIDACDNIKHTFNLDGVQYMLRMHYDSDSRYELLPTVPPILYTVPTTRKTTIGRIVGLLQIGVAYIIDAPAQPNTIEVDIDLTLLVRQTPSLAPLLDDIASLDHARIWVQQLRSVDTSSMELLQHVIRSITQYVGSEPVIEQHQCSALPRDTANELHALYYKQFMYTAACNKASWRLMDALRLTRDSVRTACRQWHRHHEHVPDFINPTNFDGHRLSVDTQSTWTVFKHQCVRGSSVRPSIPALVSATVYFDSVTGASAYHFRPRGVLWLSRLGLTVSQLTKDVSPSITATQNCYPQVLALSQALQQLSSLQEVVSAHDECAKHFTFVDIPHDNYSTTGNYVIPHIPAPIVHALSGIQVNFIY